MASSYTENGTTIFTCEMVSPFFKRLTSNGTEESERFPDKIEQFLLSSLQRFQCLEKDLLSSVVSFQDFTSHKNFMFI